MRVRGKKKARSRKDNGSNQNQKRFSHGDRNARRVFFKIGMSCVSLWLRDWLIVNWWFPYTAGEYRRCSTTYLLLQNNIRPRLNPGVAFFGDDIRSQSGRLFWSLGVFDELLR